MSQQNTEYSSVMSHWTSCKLPEKFTIKDKFYCYFTHFPNDDVMAWLEEHCGGEYRMNIFPRDPIIYFKNEAVGMHFKLVWCYE